MKTKAENKIYTRDSLLSILKNKKIVFTNGCFDVLHVGHAKYLAEAKSLGEILVVALNDDDSVKRLKGKTRPINKIDDRMLLLAHLECVDYIVSFSEDTAINTIKMFLPHIYVKGGDVVLDNVPEKSTVEECGGSIIILSHSEGYSSTSTIKKISSDN